MSPLRLPLLLLLLLLCCRCHCRQVFAPLVAAGFLEFVYGGVDVGKYCNHHPLVDSVHLTGSEATYNNIVFGSSTVQVGVCLGGLLLVMLVLLLSLPPTGTAGGWGV